MLAALPALTSFAEQLKPVGPGDGVLWNIAQTTTVIASGQYVYANTPGVWFTQHNMSLEHYGVCEATGKSIKLIASNANPCPAKVHCSPGGAALSLRTCSCPPAPSWAAACAAALELSSAAVCCQSAPQVHTLPGHAHDGSLFSPLVWFHKQLRSLGGRRAAQCSNTFICCQSAPQVHTLQGHAWFTCSICSWRQSIFTFSVVPHVAEVTGWQMSCSMQDWLLMSWLLMS